MLAAPGQHFRDYLRSHGSFEETLVALCNQCRFLGDMGAYQFLWVVNEEVPCYDAWCASRGRTPILLEDEALSRLPARQ